MFVGEAIEQIDDALRVGLLEFMGFEFDSLPVETNQQISLVRLAMERVQLYIKIEDPVLQLGNDIGVNVVHFVFSHAPGEDHHNIVAFIEGLGH